MADQLLYLRSLNEDVGGVFPGRQSTGRSRREPDERPGRKPAGRAAQHAARPGAVEWPGPWQEGRRATTASSRDGRALMIRLTLAGAAIASALVGATLLFQRVIAPGIRIENISVESDANASTAELLQLAGVQKGMPYFSTDVERIRERLEAWPPAKSVSVTKVFPASLRIQLTARKPLGIAFASLDGGEVPVVFDDDGVVFETQKDIRGWDLPVLSGIAFQNFSLGVRFPPRVVDFVKQMSALKMQSPALFSLISEYRIVPRGEGEFDVLIYPEHQHVAIRIGPHIDRDLCMYILRTLDVLEKQGTLANLKEIDFRTSDVVYTTK